LSFEFNLIPNSESAQAFGGNLQDVFGRGFGEVGRSPGAGEDSIHNHTIRVKPDDGKVGENEEHVNGGVDPRTASLYEEQAFVRREAGPEHESTQSAEETAAIGCPDWLRKRSALVGYCYEF
jgi:hypothetical protein